MKLPRQAALPRGPSTVRRESTATRRAVGVNSDQQPKQRAHWPGVPSIFADMRQRVVQQPVVSRPASTEQRPWRYELACWWTAPPSHPRSGGRQDDVDRQIRWNPRQMRPDMVGDGARAESVLCRGTRTRGGHLLEADRRNAPGGHGSDRHAARALGCGCSGLVHRSNADGYRQRWGEQHDGLSLTCSQLRRVLHQHNRQAQSMCSTSKPEQS